MAVTWIATSFGPTGARERLSTICRLNGAGMTAALKDDGIADISGYCWDGFDQILENEDDGRWTDPFNVMEKVFLGLVVLYVSYNKACFRSKILEDGISCPRKSLSNSGIKCSLLGMTSKSSGPHFDGFDGSAPSHGNAEKTVARQ